VSFVAVLVDGVSAFCVFCAIFCPFSGLKPTSVSSLV
jgi:hypothetical protein